MKDSRRKGLASTLGLVLAAMLPSIVLSALGLNHVSGVAALAGMTCFIAALMGNLRLALGLTAPLAIASALAYTFSDNPWAAAALLAVVAAIRGMSEQWGYSGPLTMAPITVAFIVAQPPTPDAVIPNALWIALVMLAAGLYAVLIAYLMRNWLPPAPPFPHLEKKRAIAFGLVLGVLVGIATWFVVRLQLGHPGAWIDLTLIVVLQPYTKDGLAKGLARAGGTLLGFLIAIAVGALVSSSLLITLIATGALIVALDLMSKRKPYWQYACAMTLAIVLFAGASTSVQSLAIDRLGATVAGVALALVAILLLEPISKRYAESIGDAKY